MSKIAILTDSSCDIPQELVLQMSATFNEWLKVESS